MNQEVIDKLEWQNPKNWVGIGLFYHSKNDSRIFVPKSRPAFGWTFNLGHRHIVPWLAILFVLPFACAMITLALK
ncbi:MAG: DUF5808 domain-containing protein [Arenimonas sp.]